MKIQPINPPLRQGQELQCVVCGRMGATVADLDGPAFQAYYHPECVPAGGYAVQPDEIGPYLQRHANELPAHCPDCYRERGVAIPARGTCPHVSK